VGYLADAARGIESIGSGIRNTVRDVFGGSQRSNANIRGETPTKSLRPRARPSDLNSGIASISNNNNIRSRRDRNDNDTRSAPVPENVEPTYASRAAEGSFVQPLNPNYDPSDPMSQRYASRPSYEALVKYRDDLKKPASKMAEGGAVGEKEQVIDAAVAAITGQLTGEEAAVALAMFVESYGEQELEKLVAAAQSKTQGGEVEGPGTGKSDDVDAAVGEKPYKLSNGEYIMPIEAVKAVGGGDHAKGIEELDRIREMAQSSRPRQGSMDPSAA